VSFLPGKRRGNQWDLIDSPTVGTLGPSLFNWWERFSVAAGQWAAASEDPIL